MLAAVAERNGGPFRVRDAYEADHSHAEIRWLVGRQAWIQLHRGVLVERSLSDAVREDPVRRHALEVAAWLVRLDGCAAASHDSAALLHRLDVIHRRPDRPPVTLTRDAGGLRTGWHRAALPGGHRERIHGADCRGWPGIERARRVVSFADGRAESVLESLGRVTLHDLGLPPPQLLVWIGDEWFWIGRVDFCWPDFGVVAEADGMLKYTDVRVLQKEKRRQEHLEQLGLAVMRFGWEEVTGRAPIWRRGGTSRSSEHGDGTVPRSVIAGSRRQDGIVTTHGDLLGGPAPTLLPDDPAAEQLAAGRDPAEVAAAVPASSLAWALLADRAYEDGRILESYAFARTGYHRGLDALRRTGWRGQEPIPWEHEPNRGFLCALHALGRAADAIGEADEAERCATFLRDSSPTAAEHLNG
jgi:hypothetical protein